MKVKTQKKKAMRKILAVAMSVTVFTCMTAFSFAESVEAEDAGAAPEITVEQMADQIPEGQTAEPEPVKRAAKVMGKATPKDTEDPEDPEEPTEPEEPVIPDPITIEKNVTTKLSGVESFFNKAASSTVSDTITVSSPVKRVLQIQKYDKAKKKWITKTKVTLNNKTEKQKLKITYPSDWSKATYNSWRIYVPKKTVTKVTTDKETGQEITTKTTYSAATVNTRTIAYNRKSLNLTAKCAVVLDSEGYIIYSKNCDTKMAQASTTKMMTMLLAFDKYGANGLNTDKSEYWKKVYLTKNAIAAGKDGSYPYLPQKYYNFGAMIYGAMVHSDNAAAEALGDYIGGSEAGFAKMMNAKAKEIGMTNTAYKNASGLDAKGHYSSARDVARLMKYTEEKYGALFKKASCRDSFTVTAYTKSGSKYKKYKDYREGSTWHYKSSGLPLTNIIGAKTGTTDAAGCCFASVYKKDGKCYYEVNLGSTGGGRFPDANKLYSYAASYGK